MLRIENSQGIARFNAVNDKSLTTHGKLRIDLHPYKPDSLGYTRHESLDLSKSEAIELRDYLNKSYPMEAE